MHRHGWAIHRYAGGCAGGSARGVLSRISTRPVALCVIASAVGTGVHVHLGAGRRFQWSPLGLPASGAHRYAGGEGVESASASGAALPRHPCTSARPASVACEFDMYAPKGVLCPVLLSLLLSCTQTPFRRGLASSLPPPCGPQVTPYTSCSLTTSWAAGTGVGMQVAIHTATAVQHAGVGADGNAAAALYMNTCTSADAEHRGYDTLHLLPPCEAPQGPATPAWRHAVPIALWGSCALLVTLFSFPRTHPNAPAPALTAPRPHWAGRWGPPPRPPCRCRSPSAGPSTLP